jgi:hypothetical protein
MQVGRRDRPSPSGHEAFLAGDHECQSYLRSLLPPIASVDIDLGARKLVEEVLESTREPVAQCTSVPTTSPRSRRRDIRALEQVRSVGTLSGGSTIRRTSCRDVAGSHTFSKVKRLHRFVRRRRV